MLFSTMLSKLGDMLQGFLQQILYSLCDSTLTMIRNDMVSFPEFRESLFKLVESIVKHCTTGFFQLESEKFQTIILIILFATKHEKPELMEIGLQTMCNVNNVVFNNP
jgi:CRM1 C terminal